MAYDATKLKDWQIAEDAEKNMPAPEDWRARLGLEKDEVIAYGRICKLDFLRRGGDRHAVPNPGPHRRNAILRPR